MIEKSVTFLTSLCACGHRRALEEQAKAKAVAAAEAEKATPSEECSSDTCSTHSEDDNSGKVCAG